MTNEQAAKEYADKYPELFDDKTRERMYKAFLAGCAHVEGIMFEFAEWANSVAIGRIFKNKMLWAYKGKRITTGQLFQIFKQQKGY